MTEALHEADLYAPGEGGAVHCGLCAHRCRIAPGSRGACRVRENRGGRLYALTYGMLVAANVDPIEKKPLYHWLPGSRSYSIATQGCNFRCRFCQNWQISQAGDAPLVGRPTPPEAVVRGATETGCLSISYTYTEPTVYFEYAMDCARLAKARGLGNCFVTNGYQTAETIERMAGVIDAANVDIKAFSDDFYRRLCKAQLQPVLDAVRLMWQRGIWVEVTTLLIPGHNDRDDELKALAGFLAGLSPDLPWHVSRYHPDYEFDEAPVTPADRIFRAVEIGETAGLRYVYAGNLRAGEHENTRCPACKATVIARTGFYVGSRNLKGSACGACGARLPITVAP